MQLPILGVKELALAISASLVIGFTGGYYVKGQFVKANQLDTVLEARHDTAKGIQESLNISANTDNKTNVSNQNNDGIRAAVASHFKGNPNDAKNFQPQKENSCTVYLDNWTVWMLDAARTGAAVDPAEFSDAEGKAPSNVALQEFIDNDLAAVGLYKELAIRHDTLVDYVNSLIQKQAQ